MDAAKGWQESPAGDDFVVPGVAGGEVVGLGVGLASLEPAQRAGAYTASSTVPFAGECADEIGRNGELVHQIHETGSVSAAEVCNIAPLKQFQHALARGALAESVQADNVGAALVGLCELPDRTIVRFLARFCRGDVEDVGAHSARDLVRCFYEAAAFDAGASAAAENTAEGGDWCGRAGHGAHVDQPLSRGLDVGVLHSQAI